MKSLVAYFSHTGENYAVGVIEKGNTEIIAEYISEITGADKFEIRPKRKYSETYSICCEEAKKEKNNDTRPALQEYADSLDAYDIIYIGYPIWFGTTPMEVFTFLEHYNFSGKTVRPFCTHEGSGLGRSEKDIRKLLPDANVEKGLAVKGCSAKSAKPEVEKWLRKNH